MKQGDVIVEVDGVEAVDQPLEKVVPRIRGDEGTKVRIQIFRSGEKKPRDLELTRAKITPPPALTSKIVTSGKKRVMVIAISEFMNGVSEAFHAAAIEALEKRVDGIVLDLRNDPGGSLNIAEDIICHWEREAPVVIMEYKGPLAIPRHCEPGAAILKGMPTSVLVNRYSASASEIVSGALQDNGVARVIGEKTYGKGCGQSVVQYPDGSILIITTFHWKTPKGRAIHKVGLEPDEKVEMDPSDVGEPDKKDPQMDRAVQFLSTGK